jgi:hypothetical protein
MGDEDLITAEGVNERGPDREAEGTDPGAPPGAGSADDPGAASAPGLAASDDEDALASAPEPNEPA